MNTLSFWTISEFVIVHVDVHTYVCVCVHPFFKGSTVKNESNGKDARKF